MATLVFCLHVCNGQSVKAGALESFLHYVVTKPKSYGTAKVTLTCKPFRHPCHERLAYRELNLDTKTT